MKTTVPSGDEVAEYRAELERLISLSIAQGKSNGLAQHNRASTYPENRPNWCRCGKGNCALMPSGNPAWGCVNCCEREALARSDAREQRVREISRTPVTPRKGGMSMMQDVFRKR